MQSADGKAPLENRSDEQGRDDRAEERHLRGLIESLLFASGEPVSLARLAEIAGRAGCEDPKPKVRRALDFLERRYVAEGAGIRLVQVAGGYQLRTAPEMSEYVRCLCEAKPWRLTRATLETLAIVAYRQPVTRAEIEAIRGVDVDAVLASLIARKLVRVVGRREGPGRPLLYGTTRRFLEVFGLKDLRSLPRLGEIGVPEPGEVEPAGEKLAADGASGEPSRAGEAAKDTEPEGTVLEAAGGGSDPVGEGGGKRPAGDGARDQGGS